ncbi:MAG: hypothetical protein ABF899_00455 [Oenococcus sp.]|uniref:hypothetical protein n=1 Tax=Oenococcus sp. TaxID=1979414 RepID=UPI0039EB1AC8
MNQIYFKFEMNKLWQRKTTWLFSLTLILCLFVGFGGQFYLQRQFVRRYTARLQQHIKRSKQQEKVGITSRRFMNPFQTEKQALKQPTRYFRDYYRFLQRARTAADSSKGDLFSPLMVGFDSSGSSGFDPMTIQATYDQLTLIKQQHLPAMFPTRLLLNENSRASYQGDLTNWSADAALYGAHFYTYGWYFLWSLVTNNYVSFLLFVVLALLACAFVSRELTKSHPAYQLLWTQGIKPGNFYRSKYVLLLAYFLLSCLLAVDVLLLVTLLTGHLGSLAYPVFHWQTDGSYDFRPLSSMLAAGGLVFILAAAFVLAVSFFFSILIKEFWGASIATIFVIVSGAFVKQLWFLPVGYLNIGQTVDGYPFLNHFSNSLWLPAGVLLSDTLLIALAGWSLLKWKRGL